MKLSICIPIYNFDVRELVYDLKKEISLNGIDAEILLIDDASDRFFIALNNTLKSEVENFVLLEKNVGRSQIRNLFLYYASGDYFLFLDCDGKIIHGEFLKKYLDFISYNPSCKVVYGGRNVMPHPKDSNHLLRWKFAVERENMPAEKRKKTPYLSFQTNNFVMKKSVLKKVHFNPEFQKYGYEDLLFAMDLKAQKIVINHIENPVLNNDIETNEIYLKKVEESIDSLQKMMSNTRVATKLSEIKLVKAYNYLIKTGTIKWFCKLFSIRKQPTREKLIKGNFSLRYLDFYKLGLLAEKMKQKNLTSL